MDFDYIELKSELRQLFTSYTDTLRCSVNPFRYDYKKRTEPGYQFEINDADVQEALIEHVGMLPILATFFYPFVTEQVKLGRVLELLAVHDIGELRHGDVNVFIKQSADDELEEIAAKEILHESLHHLLDEYNQLDTNEAKYAKSIDKIAPDIYDVFTEPNITIHRLYKQVGLQQDEIAAAVRLQKFPYMEWSVFFSGFHKSLINDLDNILNKHRT